MTEKNIFTDIVTYAESITEEDIDNWVIPSVMDAYSDKLKYLAYRVYGQNSEITSVASEAFSELAKQELRVGLHTFLFKKKHHQNGRQLDPYLRLCLNRLAQRKAWENKSIKLQHSPVCPLCREEGRKEVLIAEDGLLRCRRCTNMSERILEAIKQNKADIYLQCKYNVHSKFSLHSKAGYRCPECDKFIPSSLIINNIISCPYDNCIFMGNESALSPQTHPVVTLNNSQNIQSLESTSSITDLGMADAQYNVKDQIDVELKTLFSVISEQLDKVKRTNSKSTVIQKILMYEAFQSMVEKYPVEMVAYLVHRRQKSDFPIQSRIFQEYVKLIENHMPITIMKKNEPIDILDLTDPNLSLFNGISTFSTEVRENLTIPNKTKEEYIGGRNFKNYGPCFIGKLINVVDKNTNESILNSVTEYSFSQIKLDSTIKPGTPVIVTHYRIFSHYEMDSLVFLQRIRRAIVDSIYRRLENKKRKVGKSGEKETN